MTEILRIVLAIFLLDLGLIAYFIIISVLFPGRVSRAQLAFDRMPGRAFTLGLVNFLFFATIAFVLFTLAGRVDGLFKVILTLPAITISLLLFIILSFGLTAFVNILGERVFPAQSPWRRTMAGTLLLGIGSAVPLAGWFLLFPYAGLSGIGAIILTFFQKNTPA